MGVCLTKYSSVRSVFRGCLKVLPKGSLTARPMVKNVVTQLDGISCVVLRRIKGAETLRVQWTIDCVTRGKSTQILSET